MFGGRYESWKISREIDRVSRMKPMQINCIPRGDNEAEVGAALDSAPAAIIQLEMSFQLSD